MHVSDRCRALVCGAALLIQALCVTGGVALIAAPAFAAEAAVPAEMPDTIQAGAAADGASLPVDAVWKPQEFDFYYQSFTTFYSCSGLAEKVRRILLALGADDGTRVRVQGCDFGNSIARLPIVRIKTSSPVEATPDALSELARTRPRRELAARVRNDREKGIEVDKPFPAQWERVSLSRGSLGIEPGDCELIEQISKRLLPRLAVRVVESKMRCMPNQQSFTQPQLEVEALMTVPTAEESVARAKSRKKKRT